MDNFIYSKSEKIVVKTILAYLTVACICIPKPPFPILSTEASTMKIATKSDVLSKNNSAGNRLNPLNFKWNNHNNNNNKKRIKCTCFLPTLNPIYSIEWTKNTNLCHCENKSLWSPSPQFLVNSKLFRATNKNCTYQLMMSSTSVWLKLNITLGLLEPIDKRSFQVKPSCTIANDKCIVKLKSLQKQCPLISLEFSQKKCEAKIHSNLKDVRNSSLLLAMWSLDSNKKWSAFSNFDLLNDLECKNTICSITNAKVKAISILMSTAYQDNYLSDIYYHYKANRDITNRCILNIHSKSIDKRNPTFFGGDLRVLNEVLPNGKLLVAKIPSNQLRNCSFIMLTNPKVYVHSENNLESFKGVIMNSTDSYINLISDRKLNYQPIECDAKKPIIVDFNSTKWSCRFEFNLISNHSCQTNRFDHYPIFVNDTIKENKHPRQSPLSIVQKNENLEQANCISLFIPEEIPSNGTVVFVESLPKNSQSLIALLSIIADVRQPLEEQQKEEILIINDHQTAFDYDLIQINEGTFALILLKSSKIYNQSIDDMLEFGVSSNRSKNCLPTILQVSFRHDFVRNNKHLQNIAELNKIKIQIDQNIPIGNVVYTFDHQMILEDTDTPFYISQDNKRLLLTLNDLDKDEYKLNLKYLDEANKRLILYIMTIPTSIPTTEYNLRNEEHQCQAQFYLLFDKCRNRGHFSPLLKLPLIISTNSKLDNFSIVDGISSNSLLIDRKSGWLYTTTKRRKENDDCRNDALSTVLIRQANKINPEKCLLTTIHLPNMESASIFLIVHRPSQSENIIYMDFTIQSIKKFNALVPIVYLKHLKSILTKENVHFIHDLNASSIKIRPLLEHSMFCKNQSLEFVKRNSSIILMLISNHQHRLANELIKCEYELEGLSNNYNIQISIGYANFESKWNDKLQKKLLPTNINNNEFTFYRKNSISKWKDEQKSIVLRSYLIVALLSSIITIILITGSLLFINIIRCKCKNGNLENDIIFVNDNLSPGSGRVVPSCLLTRSQHVNVIDSADISNNNNENKDLQINSTDNTYQARSFNDYQPVVIGCRHCKHFHISKNNYDNPNLNLKQLPLTSSVNPIYNQTIANSNASKVTYKSIRINIANNTSLERKSFNEQLTNLESAIIEEQCKNTSNKKEQDILQPNRLLSDEVRTYRENTPSINVDKSYHQNWQISQI